MPKRDSSLVKRSSSVRTSVGGRGGGPSGDIGGDLAIMGGGDRTGEALPFGVVDIARLVYMRSELASLQC